MLGAGAVCDNAHKRVVDAIPNSCKHSDEGCLTEADAYNVGEINGEIHTYNVSTATHKYIGKAVLYHRPYSFGEFTLYTDSLFESFAQN
jgi:hypothetical protein